MDTASAVFLIDTKGVRFFICKSKEYLMHIKNAKDIDKIRNYDRLGQKNLRYISTRKGLHPTE